MVKQQSLFITLVFKFLPDRKKKITSSLIFTINQSTYKVIFTFFPSLIACKIDI